MTTETQSPDPVDHDLKTDPEVFDAVQRGDKTFEIRFNDRGFKVGDRLHLLKTVHTGAEMKAGAPLVYTCDEIVKTVSHVLTGYGLSEGWCCLSFAAQPIQDERAAFEAWAPSQHMRTDRWAVNPELYDDEDAISAWSGWQARAALAPMFDAAGFRAWVRKNLPDDTIIGNSAWWADHLTAWAGRFVKVAIQAPEGAQAAMRLALNELSELHGIRIFNGWGERSKTLAAISALRAALADQSDWSGAGAFIQHVQNAAGSAGADGHWLDEFLAWYKPADWLGEHRAAAVFLGSKIAALAAPAPQAPAWQPIETAPKDRTEIIGWTPACGALVLYWEDLYDGGRWSDGMYRFHHEPTHWMPLPAAPQTKEQP